MNAVIQTLFCVLYALLLMAPGVEAKMTAGDVIALILGLVIGILGICACLGHYARTHS
eukprot:m.240592 g.240592  ORF g.240592 m.240592 type:complete len:58 (+) comp15497_c0_seq1:138-311(+)